MSRRRRCCSERKQQQQRCLPVVVVVVVVVALLACLIGYAGASRNFKLSREGLEILLQEISPECNVEIQREIDQGVAVSPHCELHVERIIDEVGILRNIGPNNAGSAAASKAGIHQRPGGQRVDGPNSAGVAANAGGGEALESHGQAAVDPLELRDNQYINAAGAQVRRDSHGSTAAPGLLSRVLSAVAPAGWRFIGYLTLAVAAVGGVMFLRSNSTSSRRKRKFKVPRKPGRGGR